MSRHGLLQGVVATGVFLMLAFLGGCDSREAVADAGGVCQPGTAATCTCAGGPAGVKVCPVEAVYSNCICGWAADAGISDLVPGRDAGTTLDNGPADLPRPDQPGNPPFSPGTYVNGGVTVAADKTRVYFLNSAGYKKARVTVFDRHTFVAIGQIDLNIGTGADLVRWGHDGLAYRRKSYFHSEIVILRHKLIGQ